MTPEGKAAAVGSVRRAIAEMRDSERKAPPRALTYMVGGRPATADEWRAALAMGRPPEDDSGAGIGPPPPLRDTCRHGRPECDCDDFADDCTEGEVLPHSDTCPDACPAGDDDRLHLPEWDVGVVCPVCQTRFDVPAGAVFPLHHNGVDDTAVCDGSGLPPLPPGPVRLEGGTLDIVLQRDTLAGGHNDMRVFAEAWAEYQGGAATSERLVATGGACAPGNVEYSGDPHASIRITTAAEDAEHFGLPEVREPSMSFDEFCARDYNDPVHVVGPPCKVCSHPLAITADGTARGHDAMGILDEHHTAEPVTIMGDVGCSTIAVPWKPGFHYDRLGPNKWTFHADHATTGNPPVSPEPDPQQVESDLPGDDEDPFYAELAEHLSKPITQEELDRPQSALVFTIKQSDWDAMCAVGIKATDHPGGVLVMPDELTDPEPDVLLRDQYGATQQIVVATQPETRDLFLRAAAVMNELALACLADDAVPRDVAEGINDRQQWLSGCDWPILGWDTSDPPPGYSADPDAPKVITDARLLGVAFTTRPLPSLEFPEGGPVVVPKGIAAAAMRGSEERAAAGHPDLPRSENPSDATPERPLFGYDPPGGGGTIWMDGDRLDAQLKRDTDERIARFDAKLEREGRTHPGGPVVPPAERSPWSSDGRPVTPGLSEDLPPYSD